MKARQEGVGWDRDVYLWFGTFESQREVTRTRFRDWAKVVYVFVVWVGSGKIHKSEKQGNFSARVLGVAEGNEARLPFYFVRILLSSRKCRCCANRHLPLEFAKNSNMAVYRVILVVDEFINLAFRL